MSEGRGPQVTEQSLGKEREYILNPETREGCTEGAAFRGLRPLVKGQGSFQFFTFVPFPSFSPLPF